MSKKFSQFLPAATPQNNDEFVGLRAGLNYRFTFDPETFGFTKTTGAVSTGDIPIYDPNGNNLKSSTIHVDAQKNVTNIKSITVLQNPTNPLELATKQYIDTAVALKLDLSGGTMSGAIDMGANKITSSTAPSTGNDFTNKTYVDAQVATKQPLSAVLTAMTMNVGAIVFAGQNGSNSNNGTFHNMYIDPFFGSNSLTGTQTIPRLVVGMLSNYSATSFSIKPNVWLLGQLNARKNATSGGVWNVVNPITLDSSWDTAAANSAFYMKDIKWSSTTTFNLNFSSATNGVFCTFENSTMLSAQFAGAASHIPNISLINSEDLGSGFSFNNVNSLIEKCKATSITVSSQASGGATTFEMNNSIVTGSVSISGNTSASVTAKIKGTPIGTTLTLSGTNVTLEIDQASLPGGGIVFSGGALQSQVNILGVTPVAQNSSSNLTAWNLATAPNAEQTMTENTTLSNPTNQIKGMWYTFNFIQSSPARTLSFGTGYDLGGVTPVISTANGSENMLVFRSNGTRMKLMATTLGV